MLGTEICQSSKSTFFPLRNESNSTAAFPEGMGIVLQIQEFKRIFYDLDAWIRSQLRSMQLKKWKKPEKFQRALINVGCNPEDANERRASVNVMGTADKAANLEG